MDFGRVNVPPTTCRGIGLGGEGGLRGWGNLS